jgi:dsDNA-binding SOS-regulon protein
MKIQRVASYRTTDGKTFDGKKDAQTHQKTLDRLDSLKGLVLSGLSNGVTAPTDELVDEIATFILNNADELRSILPQRAKSADLDAFIAEQQAGLGQTPATVQ